MRVLHVFPLFGPDLPNGSERYAWRLTQALAESGIDVTVFTTCADKVKQKSGFALEWNSGFPEGVAAFPGFAVHRFPVRDMPAWWGWVASKLLDIHVDRVRKALGPPPADGSPGLALYRNRVMQRQSRLANLLMLLCLGPLSFSLYRAIWKRAAEFDVILVSFLPLLTVPIVSWIGRRRGAPVAILPLFHENDFSNNGRLLCDAMRRAPAVLTGTDGTSRLLRQLLPESNPISVGIGVDPALLSDVRISGARFREKFGLPGRKIVLCVGRKEPGKRYQVAIDAVLAAEDPEAVLLLAGDDIDGRPIAAPPERVRYLGRLSEQDLRDAYDACDLLIHPSQLESFGMTFIEAWARAKPVLGDSGGAAVAALIEDGIDGFLCSGEAASYAARIQELLASAELRESMGAAGKAKVLRQFTWPAIASQMREVYASLSASGRRSP